MAGSDDLELEDLVRFRGRVNVAYACADNGRLPARDFLDSRDITIKDRAKLHRLFQTMAEHGNVPNNENFKKLEGKREVHEFKGHKARVFCFWHHGTNTWFLTSGVMKKSDKHKPGHITTAERIWNEHRQWMKRKGIA